MADIKRKYRSNCKEYLITAQGQSFLVIFGKHINGAFCAFPKLNIAAELSAYDEDFDYNEKKLRLAFDGHNELVGYDTTVFTELARAITIAIQELPDVLPF